MRTEINLTDKNIQNDIKSLISSDLADNSLNMTIDDDRIGYLKMINKPLPGFSLCYSESKFLNGLKVFNTFEGSHYFIMHFQLKGGANYKLRGLDMNNSQEGFNNIWGLCNNKGGYLQAKEGVLNSSMTVVFDDDYLKNIAVRHSALLDKYYTKYCKREPFYLRKKNIPTTGEMKLILSQLQNMDLMGYAKDIYAESKVLELLALQLHCIDSLNKNKCNMVYPRNYNIDKIHEARVLLLSDINNPPTINDLSRITGLNEKKLQFGFKEVYNQTIYGCLFEHKMDLARRLLLDTEKTIYEIALECGYEHVSHFTTAFKKRFGITPGGIRK